MSMKTLILQLSLFILAFPIYGQPFGNAVNLDGMDDFAMVPHHPSLNPENGSWSVAFWLKAADKDQVSPVVMKRFGEDPYTQYSYGFGKDDPHDPEPGKRLRVNHIEVAGVSERSGHTTEEYIDGNWHHVVFVANKDTGGMEIFVDGIMVEFYPMYYYGSWPTLSISNDLIIASGSSGAKIEGPLDELSIWNKALNQNEIGEIMVDTLSILYYAIPDSGLVAYYRFDEYEDLGIQADGADDFRDLSFWGNHADAEGNPELIPSDIPVGVYPSENNEEIKIFPNPTCAYLNITSTSGIRSASLFDFTGKQMLIKEGFSDHLILDVSSLSPGIYSLQLINRDQNSGFYKIIIQ
jgi:hypothetical protein